MVLKYKINSVVRNFGPEYTVEGKTPPVCSEMKPSAGICDI